MPKKSSIQTHMDLPTAAPSGPVECLGQIFPSDEARREHYLKLLAEKLKDPSFRKIEGFPIGADEDILRLSDPPYYTACPNPWISDFIQHYGRPYDPKDAYHREPFAADVSEGKYHPIYKLHPYHTKVPHQAIMRYILHYTNPGEVVFDAFCGTGMTGVAAQLCGNRNEVSGLGYSVKSDGKIFDENGKYISLLGPRLAILSDLSPAATFIAYNYNTPVDAEDFGREATRILQKVREECSWMYTTLCSDGENGLVEFAIWSDVFTCPDCACEIVFWEEATDQEAGTVNETFQCPRCSMLLEKRNLPRAWDLSFDNLINKTCKQARQRQVQINYTVNGKRRKKKPDEKDLKLQKEIEAYEVKHWCPTVEIPTGEKTAEAIRLGFTNVHHLYTKRNLIALSAFLRHVKGTRFQSLLTTVAFRITKRYGLTYQAGHWGAGGGPQNGTYYIPSLIKEINILNMIEDAIGRESGRSFIRNVTSNIATSSATSSNLPDNSLDYAFFDPPFGSNLMYWELNYIWESWLKVHTRSDFDAIESKALNRNLSSYQKIMVSAFTELHRVLKPGRWVTVEFSNTKASVWNVLQNALQISGLVVASVAALDKQKKIVQCSDQSNFCQTRPRHQRLQAKRWAGGSVQEAWRKSRWGLGFSTNSSAKPTIGEDLRR
jgi:DNA modification methylase